MPWWGVLDVTTWPAQQDEPRGLRAKIWVTDAAGQLWLRKTIRAWEKVPGGSRPTEPAIEAFTLELAGACGFEVAHGRAAVWRDGEAELRGFASRKFHDENEEQWTGASLVEGFDRDDPASRIAATLDAVRAALERERERSGTDLISPFLSMLAFDAWIGNGDRHLGNWAVLVSRDGRRRLAPMFDTAGCLGAELQDGSRYLQPESFGRYVANCKSGFGDGRSIPGIRQTEVLETIRRWPEWAGVHRDVVPRLQAGLAHVDSLIGEVPDAWWPAARRDFARRLLVARVKLVEGASP